MLRYLLVLPLLALPVSGTLVSDEAKFQREQQIQQQVYQQQQEQARLYGEQRSPSKGYGPAYR